MATATSPPNLCLTAEEIRYLRPIQLEHLTGIHAPNFHRWDRGKQISERTLERLATGLRTTKPEVLRAFELRRKDLAIALTTQAKADEIINYLKLNTPESA
jgi:hypothetical protein